MRRSSQALSDVAAAEHLQRPLGERRLGADAGKGEIGDVRVERCLEFGIGVRLPVEHRFGKTSHAGERRFANESCSLD